jgi:hypothetical protein
MNYWTDCIVDLAMPLDVIATIQAEIAHALSGLDIVLALRTFAHKIKLHGSPFKVFGCNVVLAVPGSIRAEVGAIASAPLCIAHGLRFGKSTVGQLVWWHGNRNCSFAHNKGMYRICCITQITGQRQRHLK